MTMQYSKKPLFTPCSILLSTALLSLVTHAQEPTSEDLKSQVIQAIVLRSAQSISGELKSAPGSPGAIRAKQIGEQLMQLAQRNVHIRIVDGPIKPSALESGEILIPATGLDQFQDDEWMFVFAHELAHIELRHGTEKIQWAAKGCPEIKTLTTYNLRRLTDCIQASFKLENDAEQSFRRLRWKQEHQADLWAARFLKKHQLPLNHRGVLQRSAFGYSASTDTHPAAADRVELIEQMLRNESISQ